MRAMVLPVVVLVLVLLCSEPVSSIMAAHCEKMGQKAQEDLCTFESNLTNLQFPNFLGHENQEDAYTALKGYEVLLASQSKCSDSLAIFLCHTYMPVCYPEDESVIIKPCRYVYIVRCERIVCVYFKKDTYPTSCKAGNIDLQATIASKQINLSSCCQSADYCHVCLYRFRIIPVSLVMVLSNKFCVMLHCAIIHYWLILSPTRSRPIIVPYDSFISG
eukprot:sb/3469937/